MSLPNLGHRMSLPNLGHRMSCRRLGGADGGHWMRVAGSEESRDGGRSSLDERPRPMHFGPYMYSVRWIVAASTTDDALWH